MEKLVSLANSVWQLFLTLPPITQWAVAMLFVCALLAHLFAYNEQTVHEGPSNFTTAGIFFTFLGIAEGLYEFNPQNIDASIPALLDGLKTAFIASVVGVGAALSIKLRYAILGVKRSDQAARLDGATIDDLYNQLIGVQHSLVGSDESTLISQLKLSRQDSNDRLDALSRSQNAFMQKLAESNSKALIIALQEVIRDFNTKITDQFGDNFKQLNEAVGAMLEWQARYREQISEMISQQSRAAGNMEVATSRYEDLVSKTETFSVVASGLSKLLHGLESQRGQITVSLEQLGKLLESTSDSLPKIEGKVMQLTEQITFGVKKNQDDMTKVLRDSAVALQSSVADIRNLLLETTQSANTQLNDHMRSLADKTSEQIVKLDVALENELSKSISSLGRQLTALSKQFVEDYSPLTERLRTIVQMGRGA
jgi:ABC-type transporter Mla subunit MlaD